MKRPFRKCHCGELKRAIDAYIERADKDLENDLDNAGFVDPKKTVQDISDLEEEITAALEQDTKYIVETTDEYELLSNYAETGIQNATQDERLIKKLTRTFNATFSRIVPAYAEEYIKLTDKDLQMMLMSKRTVAWIESWSGDLARIMKLNDNQVIENILSKGLKEGASIKQFADMISDAGIRDAGFRARRVAITEVLRAHSVAQHESIEQSPAVTAKIWRHSGGYRIEPRENHVEMDGTVVPKNEPFTLYGADGITYYPMYPRDSALPPGESINCHCVEQPVVDESILGLSLEERQRLQAEAVAELDEEWLKEIDEKNRLRLL